MKVTLIVNPVASSVTKRSRQVIQKALSADHDLDVQETKARQDGTGLAAQAAKDGADAVISLGGDGTLNEVANGVLETDCALGVLPGGSTNVFARSIGYPNEAVEATAMLLDSLSENKPEKASVGKANGRAFLFHVGAGFDAAVVAKVEEKGKLKRYIGHPLFVASTITTWLGEVDRKRPWFDITTDDDIVIENAQFAVALNCNPYTYMGKRPLDLAPEATLTLDLSLIILTKLSFRKIVPVVVKALRSKDGISNSDATKHLTNVKEVTLSGHRPFPYQLDGEFFDPVSSLELESVRDALKIYFPTK